MFKFDNSNILLNKLNVLADMMLLSLLWIVVSIPIITIGTATAATHKTYYEIYVSKREGVPIFRTFFESFKSSFVQSTIVWLGYLGLFAIFNLNESLLSSELSYSFMNYFSKYFLTILLVVLLPFIYMVFAYISRFKNDIVSIFKNVLVMSILNFHIILIVAIFLIIGGVLVWLLPILVLIVPGVVSYFLCPRIDKVFRSFTK